MKCGTRLSGTHSILGTEKMKTEKLYRIAEENNIKLDYFSLPDNKSVCVKMGDKQFIGIDGELTLADERVCLAHELGHCQTEAFYNIYSPLDIRQKHENRADKWAVACLIPKQELLSAIKKGHREPSELAEHFCVTEEFIKKAIAIHGLC